MAELQIAFKSLLLPPGILIILMFVGLLTSRKVLGKLLIVFSISALWVLSLPFFGDRLLCAQESIPPLTDQQISTFAPQAIIVLGGGVYRGNTEYGGDTVGENLLVRLRYAAWLAHRYHLPVIPTGGSNEKEIPEARLARAVLQDEFGVKVPFIEELSRTTWQNASFTAELLKQEKIERVLLVTHSWHMPRALDIFEHANVTTLAAPTLFHCPGETEFLDWIPDADALADSRQALHEMLGRGWYGLRAAIENIRTIR